MSPPTRPTAAIIGAGIAGLACARVLQAAGWRVTNNGWHYRHDGRERYAGKPRMSAVTRHLSRGLALEASCRIVSLARD
ncbi:hypothetical protein [Halomonas alkalisoli]|uniref:hypothetical protein n=1 Tax=Halomonas alkalisoli TaxID=2907158 RepID=UPI001F1DD77A|nr:hypothetical protein [Halomonas alkalisoli]MCE9683022.1 hypothetical protein [Halomonas alkalisoli]